jgi:2-succinyl-6-hydroxy-2,4-cyclohexadiene-1-carboxylate synthase
MSSPHPQRHDVSSSSDVSASSDVTSSSGSPPPLHASYQGHGRRVVLAHGFTQDHRIWGGLDVELARNRQIVAIDLPGHGLSATVGATVTDGAALLGGIGGVADYVGYSMGARHVLQLAIDRPALVRRLVLVSGTAGIEGIGERMARRRADRALADQLDPADGSAVDLDEFLMSWVSQPLFGLVPEETQRLDLRRQASPEGLATSLRLAGTGSQVPLWDRLATVSVPVLLIAGSRDGKYVALAERMSAAIGPNAQLQVIDDADHAPHLQHPMVVAGIVRRFLDGNPA